MLAYFCISEVQFILSKDNTNRMQKKMCLRIFFAEVQFILSKDSANREICKKMLAYFCMSEVQFILSKDNTNRMQKTHFCGRTEANRSRKHTLNKEEGANPWEARIKNSPHTTFHSAMVRVSEEKFMPMRRTQRGSVA